jgi:hypothetical protein
MCCTNVNNFDKLYVKRVPDIIPILTIAYLILSNFNFQTK